ncbi:RNA 2'-phosphotransferase [Paenibacillus sp. WQ 127069]|uniref:Probable RNA 2'-phosphotransferase n=1 Tax=Paenibacillus baimaensis TaxID=2982185 RepID=A0ABT2UP39_9BACL|nr:RNA 2'-phosphotransferase [Paenibacillus sp. WQ 127069]MCU6796412.1 RNA 2'-phosphotransferase [Paenibacillus sp. WQ 127069]
MLNEKTAVGLSKLLTKLLRHTPEEFGIDLEQKDGSCKLDELLRVLHKQAKWAHITTEDIQQVVSQSDKQRFEIVGDRIRARYGHSQVKVAYLASVPPARLYHGTNSKALSSILQDGIHPMKRQYVHLSVGLQFATLAGSRRGELRIVSVDTVQAANLGVTFYYAGNEVWLADQVPAECCSLYSNDGGKEL